MPGCSDNAGPGSFETKVTQSDLVGPDKRRAMVELSQQLSAPRPAAPLTSDLALPFAPPGFEQTDAEERAAALAAATKNNQSVRIPTAHETLELICAKLTPTGTIFSGEEPRLLFGPKVVKTGAHFSVNYNGQDYDLELVSIDRTTFVVRRNGEEITRPIKPGKSK